MSIVGISHFVAAVAQRDDGPGPLAGAGGWCRELDMLQPSIDAAKAGYLAHDQASHQVRIERHAEPAPRLEFVGYPKLSHGVASYRLMAGNGDPADLVHDLVGARETGDTAPPSWLGPASAPPCRVGIRVADPQRALAFWQDGVGFRLKSAIADLGYLLAFPSFVASWRCELVLAIDAGARPRRGMLDDAGWNCISVLVTDLDADGDRLVAAGGGDLTAESGIALPDPRTGVSRDLRYKFIRGPHGEVLELLLASSALSSGAEGR